MVRKTSALKLISEGANSGHRYTISYHSGRQNGSQGSKKEFTPRGFVSSELDVGLSDRKCGLQILSAIRGILLNRRNIPIMSMSIESMLLAVNSNFLVFSVSSDDMMGQSFASLVPTVAAAESAIGLAIFVITFRVR
ncbi:hypothetical protein ACOSQ2_017002 [Xanthoceras sorbifolium]